MASLMLVTFLLCHALCMAGPMLGARSNSRTLAPCVSAQIPNSDRLVSMEKHSFLRHLHKAGIRNQHVNGARRNASIHEPPEKLKQLSDQRRRSMGKRSLDSALIESHEMGDVVYVMGRYPMRGATRTISCLAPTGSVASCIEFTLDPRSIFTSAATLNRMHLWMHYKIPHRHSAQNRTLEIHRITHEGTAHSADLITAVTVPQHGQGWIHAEVTNIFPQEKQTILLRIQWREHVHSAHGPISMIDPSHTPFLEILTRNQEDESFESVETDRRSKRDASETCTQTNQQCCLRKFYVNFADLGWTWIIRPSGYWAGYCAGACDRDQSNTYNNMIRQRVSPASNCCTPNRRKEKAPLQILYTEQSTDGTIMYKNVLLKNMIINGCGCN